MTRTQKLSNKKRPQLRRCAFCDRPGHNRSTCSDYLHSLQEASIPEKAPVSPVRFFVHHVSQQPIQSQHVVNLKNNQTAAWHEVPAITPVEENDRAFFDAYEKIKKQNSQPINYGLSAPKLETPKISSVPLPKKIEQKKSPIKNYCHDLFCSTVEYSKDTIDSIKLFIKNNFIWQKLSVAIGVLLVMLIAPGPVSSYYQDVQLTKNKIVQDSTSGFMSLQNSTVALMNANLPTAQTAINEALQSFGTAVDTMQTKHQLLQKIALVIPVLENEVKSRQQLLLAGEKIARGNTFLFQGIANSQENASSTLDKRLDVLTQYLNSAITNYSDALKNLSNVEEDSLPLQYQGPFKEFKVIFAAVLNDLENLTKLNQSIKEIFGAQGQRRYLIAFQNQNELRPTGGFIGSFAIIDIKDGRILNLEIPAGGSYDLQGQLDQYVDPPTPLFLSNKRWEFQDANWFPDFPASAQKMMWFYQHSRNVTVDGVISINATVLERLLSVIGPINDEKRAITLSSNNAIAQIQKIVEEGPEKKDNKPKQVLSDLAPTLINNFQNSQPKDLLPLLVNLQDALAKKEIQIYFSDSSAQTDIEKMGWSGKILDTNSQQDYLAVFNTNIQGQKSDAKIKQIISHQALVQADGSIIDTVVISRTHNGNADEKLYGVPNIDYIRIYVPQGSELISASGFTWPDEQQFKSPLKWNQPDNFLNQTEKEIGIDERTGTRITKEFNKTAFGNWVITEAGQTSQIQFTYKLPFKLNNVPTTNNWTWSKIVGKKNADRFQLVVQKQSGIESIFENQIIFPSGWKSNYIEGEDIELAENGASIAPLVLETDRIWGVVMEK